MKKYFVGVLAIFFFFFMGGCSPDKSDAAADASDHLRKVWSDYLRVQENMYASELWAMDYAEKFLETRDWADLMKARTAAIASARYLSELSMAEEDLSEEEYVELGKAGVDVSFQSMEIESLAGEVKEAHDFVRYSLLETLEGGVFLQANAESARESIDIQKEYIGYLCQGQCLTANYLLLVLGDEKAASAYWEDMPEKYPTLCAKRDGWNDSEKSLGENMEQSLDAIEEITLRQADLISILGAELHNKKQPEESAFQMIHTPEFLPEPEWYDPEKAGYLSFVQEEDGGIAYPESGDRLEEDAYGVYVQISDVSAEEVADYVASVQRMARNVQKDGEDAWEITMRGYNIQIRAEEGTAVLIFDGQDVTFAPLWYLEI